MSLEPIADETPSKLKARLLQALTGMPAAEPGLSLLETDPPVEAGLALLLPPVPEEPEPLELRPEDQVLAEGVSVYSMLTEPETEASDLDEALRQSAARLQQELLEAQELIAADVALERLERHMPMAEVPPSSMDLQPESVELPLFPPDADGQTSAKENAPGDPKSRFDDTLSLGMHEATRAQRPPQEQENRPASEGAASVTASGPSNFDTIPLRDSSVSGGSMADLSGYKDLSKAPLSFGDDYGSDMSYAPESHTPAVESRPQPAAQPTLQPSFSMANLPELNLDVDTEFSGNVKTLIRLVNELPEGVTKQTGAQIIRLTMEAMGISMEDVLSDAQSAQSEMLDAVRANIKKIEEYKTVIRKLETDIKYYQGKANELSEIIDLFILSNTSTKVPSVDELHH